MTKEERQVWDEKIPALKQAGVGMPGWAERARRELAAEAAARAGPETPAPRIVPVGEVRTEAKTDEPRADSSKKRKRAEAKTERRKPRTQTVERNTDTMNVRNLPEQSTEAPPEVGGVKDVDDATLLNEEQAARRLGVSARTLWTRRTNGEIPHVRIGRKVLYRPGDLERFVATQMRTDNPEQYRLSEEQLEKRFGTIRRTRMPGSRGKNNNHERVDRHGLP